MTDPKDIRIAELERALIQCGLVNRQAFRQTENFYKMMSAVDAVVADALKVEKK